MKNPNWKRPLSLALVLVALGSTAAWLEYGHRPKKEKAEEEARKLFGLGQLPIGSIRISKGNRVFAFQCLDLDQKLCKPGDNSRWEMSEPARMKADDTNVNALISTLNNLTSSETIDLSDEKPEKRSALLKDYGLSTEANQSGSNRLVEVKLADGQVKNLLLGENHPMGDGIFSLKNGDSSKVLLVATYLQSSLDHDLTYWRDKKLMTIGASQIQTVDFKSASKGAWTAARSKDGWSLRVPSKSGIEELPGDLENIDNLLSSALYLTAKQFLVENKSSPQGLAALKGARQILTFKFTSSPPSVPEPTLSVKPQASGTPVAASSPQPKTGTPETLSLTLYQTKSSSPQTGKILAVVSNQDPVYELEAKANEKLDKAPSELRLTKLITSIERFMMTRLSFSSPDLGPKPLVVKSEKNVWSLDGEKGEVGQDKIQKILDRFSGNRIRDFLPLAKAPKIVGPIYWVTLGETSAPEKRKFKLWKNGTTLYAQDLGAQKQEILVVDPAIWDILPKTRDGLKSLPGDTQPKAPPAPVGDPDENEHEH